MFCEIFQIIGSDCARLAARIIGHPVCHRIGEVQQSSGPVTQIGSDSQVLSYGTAKRRTNVDRAAQISITVRRNERGQFNEVNVTALLALNERRNGENQSARKDSEIGATDSLQ